MDCAFSSGLFGSKETVIVVFTAFLLLMFVGIFLLKMTFLGCGAGKVEDAVAADGFSEVELDCLFGPMSGHYLIYFLALEKYSRILKLSIFSTDKLRKKRLFFTVKTNLAKKYAKVSTIKLYLLIGIYQNH